MKRIIPLKKALDSPFGPDEKLARTVLAGVCNIDVGGPDDLVDEWCILCVLAAKLMRDMSVDPEHIQAILRYHADILKPAAYSWREDAVVGRSLHPVNIALCDGRLAATGPIIGAIYDYRAAKEAQMAEVPVVSAILNLSRAFELAVGAGPGSWYFQTVAAAVEADGSEDASSR